MERKKGPLNQLGSTLAGSLSRRDFLKLSVRIGAGTLALGAAGTVTSAFGNPLELRNYMPLRMLYQELGNTGMMLSGIGFGGVTTEISIPYPDVYERMLQRALDLGVNFFDASATGDGFAKDEYYQNETNYAFLSQGGRRDQVFICTKTDYPEKAITSVNNSLQNLNTDYLDIMLAHNIDNYGFYDENTNNYDDLLRWYDDMDAVIGLTNKVRFRGFSAHNASQVIRLLNDPDISSRTDVIMFITCPCDQMNPWTYHPLEELTEVYDLCQQKGVGILGMKALQSGSIPFEEKIQKLLSEPTASRIAPYVNEGSTLMQASIKWALNYHPSIATVAVGMHSFGMQEENIAAVNPKITKEDVERVMEDHKDAAGQVYDTTDRDVKTLIQNYRMGI